MGTTERECLEYARECVRLAELTKEQDMRDTLLEMARQWLAAARHEAKPPI